MDYGYNCSVCNLPIIGKVIVYHALGREDSSIFNFYHDECKSLPITRMLPSITATLRPSSMVEFMTHCLSLNEEMTEFAQRMTSEEMIAAFSDWVSLNIVRSVVNQ